MARDVPLHSCMCASGDLHLHAGPVPRRDGRVEGSASLPVRLDLELARVRSAAAEAIASGTLP